MARPLSRLLSMLKPQRRWARFSLGTMFVVVTVFCVGLAVQVDRAKRQRAAVTALHQLHVAVLYRDPTFIGNKPLERWLGAAYREQVEYVGFQSASRLIDEPERIGSALSLLADMPGFQRLNLEGLPITDDDLIRLRPLSDLRNLNLRYTKVTAAGVAELQKALAGCRIIR